MVLVQSIIVSVCVMMSAPAGEANRQDHQNFGFVDWVRTLFLWPAGNDGAPASQDPVRANDYDRQENATVAVCKRFADSTLHERFLMAAALAEVPGQPWWIKYAAVLFGEKIRCPAHEHQGGATLHERFLRSLARSESLQWLQGAFGDAVTTVSAWMHEAYSSGVTILIVPVLISWLFSSNRVMKLLHHGEAWFEWSFATCRNWLQFKPKPVTVVAESSHSEASPTGKKVPDGDPRYDVITLPFDEPIKECATTIGVAAAARLGTSGTTPRESGSQGDVSDDAAPKLPK
nr:uncharacterized protein LOC129384030 [Dermacentor andersoni]